MDQRIGGTDSYEIMGPEEQRRMPAQELNAVVLREVLQSQRALTEEAKATTQALNTIANKVSEISVRIEPLTALQTALNQHENRLTKLETTGDDGKAYAERGFRILLALWATVTGIGSIVFTYVLTHAHWH